MEGLFCFVLTSLWIVMRRFAKSVELCVINFEFHGNPTLPERNVRLKHTHCHAQ